MIVVCVIVHAVVVVVVVVVVGRCTVDVEVGVREVAAEMYPDVIVAYTQSLLLFFPQELRTVGSVFVYR